MKHTPSLLNRFLDGDLKAKDELRQRLNMSPEAFDQYFSGENLEKLKATSVKPFDPFLAGESDAKETYRDNIIKNYNLSPAFADRWVSDENITQLREAERIGIHQSAIFVICCECAEAKWPTRRVSEVKDIAKKFRKIAKELRKLLKQTEVAVSEVPNPERTSSSFLSPLPKTAPRFSGYGGFTLLLPERYRAVREMAGTEPEKGLLEHCAQDCLAAIPALADANPPHRSKHIGRSHFEEKWDNFVRNTYEPEYDKRQYDELGAWFFEVTFGKDTYQATSLTKRKQRA